MSSKIDICNIALGMISAQPIASLTESSAEAMAVNLAYSPVLKTLLEQHPWGFATKLVNLPEMEGEETGEFGYVYELPGDCLKPQGTIHTADDEQPEFKVRGRYFYTDENPLLLEYTSYIEETGLYSPAFITVFAFYLAAQIAPRLGATKLQGVMLQQGVAALRTATASDAKLTNKRSTANRTFVNVRR